MQQPISRGVVLSDGETGSRFFHRTLAETAARFPAALGKLAPLAEFKKRYGDCLARFEAARVASPERVAIARHLAEQTIGSLHLAEGGAELPLEQALSAPLGLPELQTRTSHSGPTLRAEVPCDGRDYRGLQVLELIDRMYEAQQMSPAARTALRWIVEHIEANGGVLDLRGQRFALLGAGAELSPLPLLLAGGATVLWIDVRPPPESLVGNLAYTATGDDLLGNPRAALAAVRRFAEGGPVHLGLLAYAPGKSRELRVAGSMVAIARALGPKVVRSVSMLISPTSPGELATAPIARHWPLWQRALGHTPILPGPGTYGSVPRAIVSLQGQAYQAAQYLTKITCAEALGADGLGGTPITLSANVAGITNTRSLQHPLFQAAFLAAPVFGVRIFAPATTRALNGLLMLHDLLNKEAPGAAANAHGDVTTRAKALRSQQIHGGVHTVPWQFDSAVRVAAVIGLSRKPSLLWKRA